MPHTPHANMRMENRHFILGEINALIVKRLPSLNMYHVGHFQPSLGNI